MMSGYSYSLLMRTSFWVRSLMRSRFTNFVTGPSGGSSRWVLPALPSSSWAAPTPGDTATRAIAAATTSDSPTGCGRNRVALMPILLNQSAAPVHAPTLAGRAGDARDSCGEALELSVSGGGRGDGSAEKSQAAQLFDEMLREDRMQRTLLSRGDALQERLRRARGPHGP